MRHGQSVWNKKNLFTGWVDIPLSEEGVQEALHGGKKIQNLPIDAIFTSTLIRCHMTVALSMIHHSSGKIPVFEHKEERLNAWGRIYSEETQKGVIPVHTAWELNERYYGELQGLNKAETAKKYGEDQVQQWRRSFAGVPPHGESLEMTAKRTIPYFQKTIVPYLEKGKSVYICAHGNSLRSILMHLDNLSQEEVIHLELATGEPLVYSFDRGTWTKTQLT